jgi:RNA polymerase sigma-70 factor (ECF subfamily)
VLDISRSMRRRHDTDDADRERFELLFDRHRRAVLGYALRRVEQPADAADVLGETFLVAWRRLDDVPAGSAALPWLLAVARRVLANQRRGARRRGGLAERLRGELTSLRPARGTAAPRPSDPGERGSLAAALARLSEADRELVLLVGWEELEPAQIAVVLGVTPEAVRTRLHRARARLREALEHVQRPTTEAPPAAEPPSSPESPAPTGRARTGVPPTAEPASPPASVSPPPRALADPGHPAPPHAPARRGATPPRAPWPAITSLPKESLR